MYSIARKPVKVGQLNIQLKHKWTMDITNQNIPWKHKLGHEDNLL